MTGVSSLKASIPVPLFPRNLLSPDFVGSQDSIGATTVNIIHEYYFKEVATKAVINSRAAVPEKMKRTVLTQEIIRILRNCSLLHVEEFY